MNLYRRLFPKAAELKDANARIEALEAVNGELNQRLSKLWESYNAHDATIKALRENVTSLKGRLREQTDADLLLAASKIIGTILKGQKPEQEDVSRYNYLVAQQQAMGQSSSYANLYGGGGILEALGMGNMFGRS
jgi:chromosome segregation ATPase